MVTLTAHLIIPIKRFHRQHCTMETFTHQSSNAHIMILRLVRDFKKKIVYKSHNFIMDFPILCLEMAQRNFPEQLQALYSEESATQRLILGSWQFHVRRREEANCKKGNRSSPY